MVSEPERTAPLKPKSVLEWATVVLEDRGPRVAHTTLGSLKSPDCSSVVINGRTRLPLSYGRTVTVPFMPEPS